VGTSLTYFLSGAFCKKQNVVLLTDGNVGTIYYISVHNLCTFVSCVRIRTLYPFNPLCQRRLHNGAQSGYIKTERFFIYSYHFLLMTDQELLMYHMKYALSCTRILSPLFTEQFIIICYMFLSIKIRYSKSTSYHKNLLFQAFNCCIRNVSFYK
jgi:hypothetical protein